MINEEHFKVLQALALNPENNQHQLAKNNGFSLGKLNFVMQALREKGFVKLENFSHSPNKLKYTYLLTPIGIMEKVQFTVYFLKRKEAEFQALQTEIKDFYR